MDAHRWRGNPIPGAELRGKEVRGGGGEEISSQRVIV